MLVMKTSTFAFVLALAACSAAEGATILVPGDAATIQQAINEHCIPKISENTAVQISSLGYEAELIGAAALVMEHYDTIDIKQFKNKKPKKQPVQG